MKTTDLHTHTTASDGSLTPTELVAAAVDAGVDVLGITDHDTTEGLAEAATAAVTAGLELVPGIELSTTTGASHLDVLGYFIAPDDPDLATLLQTIRVARDERARAMVERLQGLGSSIRYEDVAALSGSGSVGRPHVALALVAEGFVADVPSAFRYYLADGRPAYVERYKLTPPEACAAIRGAGGVPVMAHPVPPERGFADPHHLRKILPGLRDAGLGGLECYYPGYTAPVTRWLKVLAKHFKLIPTGGSDFHGPWRPDRPLGSVQVPENTVERLREAAG